MIDSLQLTAKHKVSTPVNWQQGEDRDHRRFRLQRRGQGDLWRVAGAEALHPHRSAAALIYEACAPPSGARRLSCPSPRLDQLLVQNPARIFAYLR